MEDYTAAVTSIGTCDGMQIQVRIRDYTKKLLQEDNMAKYRTEQEMKDIIADQAEQIMELRHWLDYWKQKVEEYESSQRSSD